MTKDIKFSGFTSVPSDYECTDGTLAAALNHVCENSHIVPVMQPRKVLSLSNDGSIALIHYTNSHTNYIIQRDKSLYWLDMSNPDDIASDDDAAFIAQFPAGINDVTSVGNTIIVLSDATYYILFRDRSYTLLGDRPPFIDIMFGCQKVGTLLDSFQFTVPAHALNNGRFTSVPDITNISDNAILGALFHSLADNVTSQGYFYQPFFVRYAFRLYDGSYCWHSAPILQLPSVTIPLIRTSNTRNGDEFIFSNNLDVPYFQLTYGIINARADILALAKWSDIISSVDIFVTPPIYTYDQSAHISGYRSSDKLRPVGFNLVSKHGRGSSTQNSSDSFFSGHYADLDTYNYTDHSFSTQSNNNSHFWAINENENFIDQIRSCHAGCFYRIASIPTDKLAMTDAHIPVPLITKHLDNISTLQRLPDEFQSHHFISASSALAYNNRLCLSNITIKPPVPFSLRSSVCASTSSSTQSFVEIQVFTRLNGVICQSTNYADDPNFWDMTNNFPRYIYYPDSSAYKINFRYNDTDHFINLTPHDFLNGAYYFGSLDLDPIPPSFANPETNPAADSSLFANKVYLSEINCPFLFPPSYVTTIGNANILALSTAARALSQGQFGQFPVYAFTDQGIWAIEVAANGTFSARQPISRDICINPASITQLDAAVLFPSARGIMMLSGSNAICITDCLRDIPFDIFSLPRLQATAAKYIPGILNPDNTSILDSLGSGSSTSPSIPDSPSSNTPSGNDPNYVNPGISNPNIPDILPSDIPTPSLPSPSQIISLDAPFPLSFNSFIDGCSMLYDYQGQRIIFFNPHIPYAYIYSLQSQLWGLMISNLKKTVKSYPNALAINVSGELLDFSNPTDIPLPGLIVSRPIKLDLPDILKTIDTAIIRGNFRRGHILSILYGSRDLVNWHIVWSSRDHFLRGFSGSPYKYFRLACITNLSYTESISGASFQFNPRLTDKPR